MKKKRGRDWDYFTLFGSYIIRTARYKDILWIEAKRWEIVERIEKFFREKYKPWSEELFRLGSFCATHTNKKGEKYPIAFLTHKNPYKSFSQDYGYDIEKKIKYSPLEKLPLLMGDLLNEKERLLIEKRFKGEIPEPIYREDLYKEYLRNEQRMMRLYKLRDICSGIIDRKISDKYYDLFPFPSEGQLKITIHGRDYWYKYDRTLTVIRRPEDTLIEETVDKDFENNPRGTCRRIF